LRAVAVSTADASIRAFAEDPMHDCTVTHQNGPAALTVVVVGHCAAKLPAPVERAAARIAGGELKAPLMALVEDRRFLLVQPTAKPWLVGGEAWRLLGKEVVDAARAARVAAVLVQLDGVDADAQSLVEGCLLADYRFNLLRSGKDAERPQLTVRIPGQAEAVGRAVLVAQAQNLARELADTPPNQLNPKTFAERARVECRRVRLGCRVISGTAALRRARFPGLAQVGQAGSTEPALVEISYRPRGARRGAPNLALVGKGVTFDTGGISLKPGDKMWEMKGDMGGAAAVLAAMTLIARLQPRLPVTGYLCLAENMPDSRAQRPGDIYRARNGKTIHVDNTDAEGRLILSDVLTYACERGATHLVDVATLTGACCVALGNNIAGLMGRHPAFLDQVRAAGLDVGEELWPLPLYGEYRQLIDHPHADMNNVGGRYGGALTAGLFLAEFVPDTVHWAHLDIAGPAIQSGGWRYYSKGMTGFATRSLARLAQKLG
jgi:leucyl aminopeptidase